MTTTQLPGTEVSAFASAVRAALSDLPPDELDELTDGLEADLAERAEESGLDLGDPGAYAEELRAAAGYPPRSARSHLGDTLPNLRTVPQELRRRWDALVASHSLIASAVSFFVALRPAWWVLRGLVVWALVAGFFGVGAVTWWPFAVAAVVLSVQLGRGRMLGRAWVRGTLVVVSVIAVVAAPFLIQKALDTWTNAGYYQSVDETYYPQGLTRDGIPIDNIFAYDAQGQPIDQVQLFDQTGQPLDLVGDTSSDFWGAQDGSMVVPNGDVPGRAGWNVFPLSHVNSWSDYEDDGALDDSEISATDFPVTSVKPLSGYEATGTPMTEGTPLAGPTTAPAP